MKLELRPVNDDSPSFGWALLFVFSVAMAGVMALFAVWALAQGAIEAFSQ